MRSYERQYNFKKFELIDIRAVRTKLIFLITQILYYLHLKLLCYKSLNILKEI